MSFINYKNMEINCKVVYFGPSAGGKTTNLRYIHSQTHPDGALLPINTKSTRLFDFLPLALGTLNGFKVRFHLYAVPGQTESAHTHFLQSIDGIIFVCDSQVNRIEANMESFHNLKQTLEQQDLDIQKIPLVFQYNKRDIPNICPIEELSKEINSIEALEFPATATTGQGVLKTLDSLTKRIVGELKNQTQLVQLESEKKGPQPLPKLRPHRKDSLTV